MEIARIVGLLEEVAARAVPDDFLERYGYPPGDDHVERASGAGGLGALEAEFPGRVPPDVAEFFRLVTVVSLPDIWNAYHIGSADWIAEIHRAREPRYVRIDGEDREFMILASNGGGDMYGLPVAAGGPMYVMPHAGIENGVYDTASSFAEPFRPAADTFAAFLRQLAETWLSGGRDPYDPYRP